MGWVGSGANDAERRSANGYGFQYLKERSKPKGTPIHMFKEGRPINNALWVEIFGPAPVDAAATREAPKYRAPSTKNEAPSTKNVAPSTKSEVGCCAACTIS